MRDKFGLVSISFRSYSPEQILEAMKAAGLCYIEWGSDVHVPPEKAEEIALLQKSRGITCCSYGTYFRLGTTPMEELTKYIGAAKILGTNILRLWCGSKNSEEYTEEEKAAFFQVCRAAADIAEQNGVILCMECHNNTYTNKKEAAYELMQAVNSGHFQMYWQPNQFRSIEENIAYAKLLKPYIHHIHVFQWKGRERFPLAQGVDEWRQYLQVLGSEHTLLLEFMPHDEITELPGEAETLFTLTGGSL